MYCESVEIHLRVIKSVGYIVNRRDLVVGYTVTIHSIYSSGHDSIAIERNPEYMLTFNAGSIPQLFAEVALSKIHQPLFERVFVAVPPCVAQVSRQFHQSLTVIENRVKLLNVILALRPS